MFAKHRAECGEQRNVQNEDTAGSMYPKIRAHVNARLGGRRESEGRNGRNGCSAAVHAG